MIYKKTEGKKFCFLNPHRCDDGEPDACTFSLEELLERLPEECHIGGFRKSSTENIQPEANPQEILAVLEQYQRDFIAFAEKKQTRQEMFAIRDKLLRPLAIDLLSMMEIIGQKELAESLAIIQKDIFGLLAKEEAVPKDVLDMKVIRQVISQYKELVAERNAQ